MRVQSLHKNQLALELYLEIRQNSTKLRSIFGVRGVKGMLLRFGVENYRSLRDYQEISFVASKLSGETSHLIDGLPKGHKGLPALGLFGANASGKSNVLSALNFLCRGILHSHSGRDLRDGTPRVAFKLDPLTLSKPTKLVCDFLIDGARYRFGLALDDKVILEEWLYSYPKGKRQVWYHRRRSDDDEYYFGSFLKGKNQTIASFTRPNSLFLSTAVQNNHEQLSPIYGFFDRQIDFRLDVARAYPATLAGYVENPNRRPRFLDFLLFADFGIGDVRIRQSGHDAPSPAPSTDNPILTELARDLTSVFAKYKDELPEFDIEEDPKTVEFSHMGHGGEKVFFHLSDESRGTRSFGAILGPALEAIDRGGLLVVDELEASLHPLLARKIVGLFCSSTGNPKGAQLLFSSHDTNILSDGVLRRDQVWLTEKNSEGATRVYPLTDFRSRPTDNLEKGYLEGRYGGIPTLGDWDRLFANAED